MLGSVGMTGGGGGMVGALRRLVALTAPLGCIGVVAALRLLPAPEVLALRRRLLVVLAGGGASAASLVRGRRLDPLLLARRLLGVLLRGVSGF
jgi:hypothetical protein